MSENGRITQQIIYDELRDFRAETRARFDRMEHRVDRLEAERDQNYWPRTVLSWTLKALVGMGVPAAIAFVVALNAV